MHLIVKILKIASFKIYINCPVPQISVFELSSSSIKVRKLSPVSNKVFELRDSKRLL